MHVMCIGLRWTVRVLRKIIPLCFTPLVVTIIQLLQHRLFPLRCKQRKSPSTSQLSLAASCTYFRQSAATSHESQCPASPPHACRRSGLAEQPVPLCFLRYKKMPHTRIPLSTVPQLMHRMSTVTRRSLVTLLRRPHVCLYTVQ